MTVLFFASVLFRRAIVAQNWMDWLILVRCAGKRTDVSFATFNWTFVQRTDRFANFAASGRELIQMLGSEFGALDSES